jgi:hypothetical protein
VQNKAWLGHMVNRGKRTKLMNTANMGLFTIFGPTWRISLKELKLWRFQTWL